MRTWMLQKQKYLRFVCSSPANVDFYTMLKLYEMLYDDLDLQFIFHNCKDIDYREIIQPEQKSMVLSRP